MANEKIYDFTKSAAENETAVNQKFNELEQQGGGGVSPAEPLNTNIDPYRGDNIGNAPFPTDILRTYNTAHLIQDVQSSRVDISGNYGHEPQMLVHEGFAYVAYMYQTQGSGEGQAAGYSKVRITKVNLSTMEVVSSVIVAEQDNTFSYTDGGSTITKTIWSAGSPNIALVSGKIRIMFTAWLTDTNQYAGYDTHESVICHRDYTISDASLGNITICTFTKDGTTYPLTFTNFRAQVEGYGDVLQVHCQYAYINSKYYICIGNGTSGKNGHIFTTTDFANYAYWQGISIPSIDHDLGFNYEMALFPWIDSATEVLLYCAIRRSSDKHNIIVVALYMGLKYNNGYVASSSTPGAVRMYSTIPCEGSRPCFFLDGGNTLETAYNKAPLMLMYDAAGQDYAQRLYTSVAALTKHTFSGATKGIIAQGLRMTYPAIIYDGTDYLVAYQGKVNTTTAAPHIFLSKFRAPSCDMGKAVAAMAKMFDTFGPEEE